MKEDFDPQKFFHGFIDPAMLRKVLPLMFWICLVLLFCFGSALVVIKVKDAFFPKKAVPVQVQTNTGTVETNSDKRNKFGVINF